MILEPSAQSIGLRMRQAARLLNVSERTLHTWTRRGLVKYTRIGRTVLFAPEDLKALVAGVKE